MKPKEYYISKLSSLGFIFPNLPSDKIGDMEIKEFSNQKKLYVNGQQWMGLNLTDHREIFQFVSHIEISKGDVITTGMGFLLRENWLLQKGHSVTVIEQNENIINYHLKHNPDICSKLNIIHGDANNHIGKCDTLLLDHFELEDNDKILNDVQKVKNNIHCDTLWFWPIERMIIKKSVNDKISYSSSYSSFRDLIPELPVMDNPSLERYLDLWMVRI